MAEFLQTMVGITDPERSRSFYEALGLEFERDMDIVRDGELEATNYFFGIGDQKAVLELTYNHDAPPKELGRGYRPPSRWGRSPRPHPRGPAAARKPSRGGSRTAYAKAAPCSASCAIQTDTG